MTASLLEVSGLKVWYPIRRGIWSRTVGYVQAVTDVDLTIREGETLGLVGESGCGKSTLGRAIAGLEEPMGGTMRFAGAPLPGRARGAAVRRAIQMVFQDPAASLNPRMTIRETLTEGMAHHGLLAGTTDDAARTLLSDVGLDASALHRYPFEFSGGQRQRINIARALSLRPRLIVCDEAVSALDVSVQAQVLNLLMDLREAYRLSLLFISHDLGVVRFLSDRIAVMYLGRIVEEGPASAILEAPLHPYTQALVGAVLRPGEPRRSRPLLAGEPPSPAKPPPGCPFHPRCPKAFGPCASVVPSRIDRGGHSVSCHLHGPSL